MQTVHDSDVIWLQVPVDQTRSQQASPSTQAFQAKSSFVSTWWMIMLIDWAPEVDIMQLSNRQGTLQMDVFMYVEQNGCKISH